MGERCDDPQCNRSRPESWQCLASRTACIPISGDGCGDLRITQPGAMSYATGGVNAPR